MSDKKQQEESLSTSKGLGPSEGRWSKDIENFPLQIRLSTVGSFLESISSDSLEQNKKVLFKEDVQKKKTFTKPHPFLHSLLQSRITYDVQATKKGGDFELPGGAHLKIPEGLYAKKETITVALIPPNKRHEYSPSIKPYEKLASNIYLIHAKSTLKGQIDLHLPSLLPETENIVALYKPPNEPWHEIKDINKQSDGLTVHTSQQGAYTLLEKPTEESFPVTPNGNLYQSRICRNTSLRIPKRCTTFDGACVLKIFKLNENRIAHGRIFYQRECASVEHLSDFYDFSFPGAPEPPYFKRPVTLKLPVPEWVAALLEDDIPPNLTVMVLINHRWQIHDAPLKMTKSTVAFDTTILTRFCLIHPRKDCRVRAHLSMPRLETSNQIIGGDILMFALLDTRAWHLLAECVRHSRVVEVISERVKKGFTFLRRIPLETGEQENQKGLSRTWVRPDADHFTKCYSHFQKSKTTRFDDRTSSIAQAEQEELELRNSAVYLLSIDGDLRFKESPSSEESKADDESAANVLHLQFHELFEDNYRFVEIEPKPALKEKAEAFFLESVASEREKKAKERKAAKEQEEQEKKAAAMARSPFRAEGSVKQNGLREANGEAYAAPLPSPTAPCEPSNELPTSDTEEDAESDMAKQLVNSCITCRRSTFEAGDADLCNNGDPLPDESLIFARYPLVVDVQDVIDYFAFEAPPEVDPEAEAKAKAEAEAKAKAEAEAEAKAEARRVKKAEEKAKKAKSTTASFQRLTTATKQPQTIVKESRVLSGRSLQILSRYVQNGLALAVHLNLPDSVITGIGFDSLSNLHSLNDVTYKVLLHWKRTYNAKKKDDMVPDLCAALKEMEMVGAAAVIADRHRNNLELTAGCFDF